MVHLLNLLAAIALLVWGTQIVRTGILRVFGENLRHVLAVGMASRVQALLAGAGRDQPDPVEHGHLPDRDLVPRPRAGAAGRRRWR